MRAEIISKLGELEKYVRLLGEYRKRSRKEIERDPTLRGAVERYMQLAIEVVIETGEMIIASEGFEKPETYREVIEILGKAGVLQQAFARRFAPAAGFRNILVHQYGRLDLEELYAYLQKNLGDFDIFARQVSAYLRKKG